MDFQLDSGLDLALRNAARGLGVPHYIHSNDLLFDYIFKRDGDAAVSSYFQGGLSDARQAKSALERVIPSWSAKKLKILEFAAGYGRVSRHAHNVFPGHQYVASDIHPQAVDFLCDHCRIDSCLSSHEPDDLDVGNGYDFIFVLSLFSHLPGHSFGRWLGALYSILACNGILLFTTHGDFARKRFPVPFESMLDPALGWGFGSDSDQPDLDGGEYGTMIVANKYVVNAIDSYCRGSQLMRFESGPWFGLQDEWMIRRPGDS